MLNNRPKVSADRNEANEAEAERLYEIDNKHRSVWLGTANTNKDRQMENFRQYSPWYPLPTHLIKINSITTL